MERGGLPSKTQFCGVLLHTHCTLEVGVLMTHSKGLTKCVKDGSTVHLSRRIWRGHQDIGLSWVMDDVVSSLNVVSEGFLGIHDNPSD